MTQILHDPPRESYILPGFTTGYRALDHALGGIGEDELVLLASRPGNYGRILLENLTVGLSRQHKVLYLSTGRKAFAVASELRSILLPAPSGESPAEDTLEDLNRLAQNLFIDDAAIFLGYLDHVIGKFHAEHGTDAIVLIDHLNGLYLSKEIRTGRREREEYGIADNLKRIALKYPIPVIVHARIRQAMASEHGNPPCIGDLMHLTGLNDRFDKIVVVHRPGYYHAASDETNPSDANNLYLYPLRGANRDTVMLRISDDNRFLLTEK